MNENSTVNNNCTSILQSAGNVGNIGGGVSPTVITAPNVTMTTTKESSLSSLSQELGNLNENTWFGIGKHFILY